MTAKPKRVQKRAAPKLRGRLRPVNLGLPPELIERVDKTATAEHRSRTNMIEVLIYEALAARQKGA